MRQTVALRVAHVVRHRALRTGPRARHCGRLAPVRITPLLLCAALAWPGTARAGGRARRPAPDDVAEAPFAFADFGWMNGQNDQPESLLKLGPVTGSLYVDTYFLWAFAQPVDHTAFPSSVAPRFNEAGLNLASIGVTLPANAIDTSSGGPIGQLALQYGSSAETTAGSDSTFGRGYFLSQSGFQAIRAASAGWHFHFLHGLELEAGVLSSYIGAESYLTQENWHYFHSFLADATPFYMAGAVARLYPTPHVDVEAWMVDGWQTFGQWHEAGAGGYAVTWRPTGRLSLTHDAYLGQDVPDDDQSLRWFTDNSAQVEYFAASHGFVRSLAVCAIADLGYEHLTVRPGGWRGGVALSHRIGFVGNVFLAVRGDAYLDEGQVLVPSLPSGYARPDTTSTFRGGGVTATLDYRPSPWLLVRLEYMHREANVPLFSGPGGITGPGGKPVSADNPGPFTPDLAKHDDRAIFAVTLRL